MKIETALNQTVLSALLVVGTIVLGAITFKYSGRIQLGIGSNGVQMVIDGNPTPQPLMSK